MYKLQIELKENLLDLNLNELENELYNIDETGLYLFEKKECKHSRNNLIKHWVKMVTNQVTQYMPVKFLLGTYRRLQLLISYRVHISNMVTHARWNDRVRGPKDLATMTDFIFLVGKDNSYERMHLRFFFQTHISHQST